MEPIKDILKARVLTSSTGTSTPIHPLTQDSPPLLQRKPLGEMAQSLNVNPEHTFDSFSDVPGISEPMTAIRQVISGNGFMVMVYGGVGNGKTRLLEAASIDLYRQGKFARVCQFSRILAVLKMSISNKEMDGYDVILQRYCTAPNLIMDDVGASGSDSDFGDRILEDIICSRYGHQLLTIMSTNRDINTLPERVLSRFKDQSTSYLVLNKAADYRPKLGVK